MSQHIALGACQILRLSALAKACEHIQGAKLTLHSTENHFQGSIAFTENETLARDHVNAWMSTLHLRFIPHEGVRAHVPTFDPVTGAITNGHVGLHYDGDVRFSVEKVIGKDGSRLREYYNREVGIETLREIYGENITFREWDEVIDGVTMPQVEAIASDETTEGQTAIATII